MMRRNHCFSSASYAGGASTGFIGLTSLTQYDYVQPCPPFLPLGDFLLPWKARTFLAAGAFGPTGVRLAPSKKSTQETSRRKSSQETQRKKSTQELLAKTVRKTTQHGRCAQTASVQTASVGKSEKKCRGAKSSAKCTAPQSESFSLMFAFCVISERLNAVVSAKVPASANIHVYVALNVSHVKMGGGGDTRSFDRFVPTVMVRKGLDGFSYNLFTAPVAIDSISTMESFIALSSERLMTWVGSQGIPLRGELRAHDVSPPTQPFPKTFSASRMDIHTTSAPDVGVGSGHAVDGVSGDADDFLFSTGPSHKSNGLFSKPASATGSRGDARGRSGIRVVLDGQTLRKASEGDLTTGAHREMASVYTAPRVLGSPSVATSEGAAQSDSSVITNADSMLDPISSHLPPSAVSIINGNFPSNLFYFRGENLQSVQNKRTGVLYRQIRHLRNVLAGAGGVTMNGDASARGGFVSVKILPWAQYSSHFTTNEMLRGHTMTAMAARGEFEDDVSMVDINMAAPHPTDPDAFFVSIELFTGEVMEAGRLAHNAQYPPLHVLRPDALLRGSVLPSSATSIAVSSLLSGGGVPHDGTRMWVSSNRRFYVGFADSQRGPLGVLREMLGNLLEAFDIGTADMFSEESNLCRKLDSNINMHLPRNFAEIVTRHYLGMPTGITSDYIASQSCYYSEARIGLCGNYLLDHEGELIRPTGLTGGPSETEYASVSRGCDHQLCAEGGVGDSLLWGGNNPSDVFNGGRTPAESLVDLGLDNLFSPLSGFPPVVVGYGVGSSKKEAADPGLLQLVRRNFYREVGGGGHTGGVSVVLSPAAPGFAEGAEGPAELANRVLSDRLQSTFGPMPDILIAGGGCAGGRFAGVKLPRGVQALNVEYLTFAWSTFLETIRRHEKGLVSRAPLDGSRGLPASQSQGGRRLSLEETAVMALRQTMLGSPDLQGLGFTIRSSMSRVEAPVESGVGEAEGGIIGATVALWTSEVILHNLGRTVIGRGTAGRRASSKHASVMDALSRLAPEEVVRLEQGHDIFFGAQVSNGSSSRNAVALSPDIGGDVHIGDTSDESFDPLSAILLEGDQGMMGSGADGVHGGLGGVQESVAPGAVQGWPMDENAHTSLPSHCYTPATSMVSLYRRALQMQLEALVSEADDDTRHGELERGSQWPALGPMRDLYNYVRESEAPVDLGLDEVIVVEGPTGSVLDEADMIGRSTGAHHAGPLYRCSLYGTCNRGEKRVLLVSSQLWPSPPLARLNAFCTAYSALVHDPSLLEETTARLGGGVTPRYNISDPSLGVLCDVCLYHLGIQATVVRSVTVGAGGLGVTCANITVPSASRDVLPRDVPVPSEWVLSSVLHADPDYAQRIATLSALRTLREASRATGHVPSPSRSPDFAAPQCPSLPPLPSIAFDISLGADAKGFLAKVLTLLAHEESDLESLIRQQSGERHHVVDEMPLQGTLVTLVVRGFADPTRLRILWDDRMWAGSSVSCVRNACRFADDYITVLDDAILALRAGEAQLVSEDRPVTPSLVTSEAASAVHKILSTSTPVTVALHRYDPSNTDNMGRAALPLPIASSPASSGVLSAIDGLVASLIDRLGSRCERGGLSSVGYRDLVSQKVEALRAKCMCTTDATAATLTALDMAGQARLEGMEGPPQSNDVIGGLPPPALHAVAASIGLSATAPPPLPIVPASGSILGPRKAFNKSRHLKYENYLERFVLMLFGKTMDVFYTRPSGGVRRRGDGGYGRNSTHFGPLSVHEGVDASCNAHLSKAFTSAQGCSGGDATDASAVVHNWYCVLGIELFTDEQRSLVDVAMNCPTAAPSVPLHIARRLVEFNDGADCASILPIGSLSKSGGVFFEGATGASMVTSGGVGVGCVYASDTDSLRRGFGGTIADVRQGFIVLGFGSGETKKDAHTAAAIHALKWHFPEQLQELIRRGVRW